MRVLPALVALLLVVVLTPAPGMASAPAESKSYVAAGVGIGVEGVHVGPPLLYQTLGPHPLPLDVPPSASFTLGASARTVSVLVEDKFSATVGWGFCIVWPTGTRCEPLTLSRLDSLVADPFIPSANYPTGSRVDVYVYSVSTDPTRGLEGIGTLGTTTMWYN